MPWREDNGNGKGDWNGSWASKNRWGGDAAAWSWNQSSSWKQWHQTDASASTSQSRPAGAPPQPPPQPPPPPAPAPAARTVASANSVLPPMQPTAPPPAELLREPVPVQPAEPPPAHLLQKREPILVPPRPPKAPGQGLKKPGMVVLPAKADKRPPPPPAAPASSPDAAWHDDGPAHKSRRRSWGAQEWSAAQAPEEASAQRKMPVSSASRPSADSVLEAVLGEWKDTFGATYSVSLDTTSTWAGHVCNVTCKKRSGATQPTHQIWVKDGGTTFGKRWELDVRNLDEAELHWQKKGYHQGPREEFVWSRPEEKDGDSAEAPADAAAPEAEGDAVTRDPEDEQSMSVSEPASDEMEEERVNDDGDGSEDDKETWAVEYDDAVAEAADVGESAADVEEAAADVEEAAAADDADAGEGSPASDPAPSAAPGVQLSDLYGMLETVREEAERLGHVEEMDLTRDPRFERWDAHFPEGDRDRLSKFVLRKHRTAVTFGGEPQWYYTAFVEGDYRILLRALPGGTCPPVFETGARLVYGVGTRSVVEPITGMDILWAFGELARALAQCSDWGSALACDDILAYLESSRPAVGERCRAGFELEANGQLEEAEAAFRKVGSDLGIHFTDRHHWELSPAIKEQWVSYLSDDNPERFWHKLHKEYCFVKKFQCDLQKLLTNSTTVAGRSLDAMAGQLAEMKASYPEAFKSHSALVDILSEGDAEEALRWQRSHSEFVEIRVNTDAVRLVGRHSAQEACLEDLLRGEEEGSIEESVRLLVRPPGTDQDPHKGPQYTLDVVRYGGQYYALSPRSLACLLQARRRCQSEGLAARAKELMTARARAYPLHTLCRWPGPKERMQAAEPISALWKLYDSLSFMPSAASASPRGEEVAADASEVEPSGSPPTAHSAEHAEGAAGGKRKLPMASKAAPPPRPSSSPSDVGGGQDDPEYEDDGGE